MGMIFDISRFSLLDGPGIRTAVFLKGCPLDCAWCHNPESKKLKPQLAFFREKCAECGACGFCKSQKPPPERAVDYSCCTACGKCVEKCPFDALKIYGYEQSPEQIIETAIKDKAYYDSSGGGLTLTGGEPLFQPEFCVKILELAKKHKIHTAVETCGFAAREVFDKILPLTDLFLYDYKADKQKHKALTGADRTLIDENLEYILSKGAAVILRCPIIPGVNENETELDGYIRRHSKIQSVEKLPYHSAGEFKKAAIKAD